MNWVDCVALMLDTTGSTILQDKRREEGMRRGAEEGGRGVQLMAVLSCLLFEAAELTSVYFLFFHSQENLLVLQEGEREEENENFYEKQEWQN